VEGEAEHAETLTFQSYVHVRVVKMASRLGHLVRQADTVYSGPMPTLEAQLTALTQEFVAKLVDALRNASFAEVASLSGPRAAPRSADKARGPRPAARPAAQAGGAGSRQTAAKRAELGERVIDALRVASQPIGVRALSSELGVAPDVLAVPLRELRAAGKIRKHGEKRSTTYSAA
jgi:hypothetical protein